MTVFIMEYRIHDYRISDAFRRDPKYGKRTFFADSDDLGTSDIAAVVSAAKQRECTPEGYALFSVTDRNSGQSTDMTDYTSLQKRCQRGEPRVADAQ